MTFSSSNIGSHLSSQFFLKMLRSQLDTAQAQISTGKISDNLSGLGNQGASQTISFRNKINVLSGYTSNLNLAKTKFVVMDNALGSITDEARTLMTTLRSQLQGATPKAGIISDSAGSALTNTVSLLNTQVNGQYQFAGDNFYTAPFTNQTTLDTNVGGLVAGFLAGSPTVSSVVAAARAVTTSNMGYSATAVSAGSVSFRADDGVDIDYTTNASQQGFADILRGMNLIKNLPQPTTPAEQANYWTVVNSAIQLLDQGAARVDQYQGLLGNKAKLVDDLLSKHDEVSSEYEQFVGSIEDSDVAEASTRLQNLQTQLQMSYSIIGQLKGLSLINYI